MPIVDDPDAHLRRCGQYPAQPIHDRASCQMMLQRSPVMGEQLSLVGMDDPVLLSPPAPALPRLQPVPPPTPQATLQQLPQPWQHPQATRQVELQGREVRYVFKRGQRRTIGLGITAQGLTVSAPRWVTLQAVDEALQAKAAWVLRKLTQVGNQHQVLQAARLVWADGVQLAWLGGMLTVRVGAPTVRRGQPLVQRTDDVLWVALPATATADRLRDAVQAWMMRTAQAHFVVRLDHFAPLLRVRWTSLRLSGAATRWGSAKADGSIRLHWRLMQFSADVVDYVVAHELSHLRHMDHSERFWQTVASVVPDFAALRAQLKGERLPPW